MSTETKQYIAPYWVRFGNGTKGCVEATSIEAAKEQADQMGRGGVSKIDSLPYPAWPRLSEIKSDCPSFCSTPDQCIGNSYCRKSYACTE